MPDAATSPRLIVVRSGQAPPPLGAGEPTFGDTAELPVGELRAMLRTSPAPKPGAQRKLAHHPRPSRRPALARLLAALKTSHSGPPRQRARAAGRRAELAREAGVR